MLWSIYELVFSLSASRKASRPSEGKVTASTLMVDSAGESASSSTSGFFGVSSGRS